MLVNGSKNACYAQQNYDNMFVPGSTRNLLEFVALVSSILIQFIGGSMGKLLFAGINDPQYQQTGTFFPTTARPIFPLTSSPTQFTVGPPQNQYNITFQACCQSCPSCPNNCVSFANVLSMVGLECCGDQAINYYDRICCERKSYLRRDGNRYYDRCCGDKPYSYDQTCCKGKVYDTQAHTCCGDRPYDIYDRTKICCAEIVYDVPSNVTTPACCTDKMYDAWGGSQFCCGGQVYNRSSHNACCVKYRASDNDPLIAQGFNMDTHQCCDGVYDKYFNDSCCYIFDTISMTKPPRPVPYRSQIHCCDLDAVKNLNPQGECPGSGNGGITAPLPPLTPPIIPFTPPIFP